MVHAPHSPHGFEAGQGSIAHPPMHISLVSGSTAPQATPVLSPSAGIHLMFGVRKILCVL